MMLSQLDKFHERRREDAAGHSWHKANRQLPMQSFRVGTHRRVGKLVNSQHIDAAVVGAGLLVGEPGGAFSWS